MSVFGDLYHIADRVKEFDPSYLLLHIEKDKYKVIAKKRRSIREGTYDGCPLFSLRDYEETIFEWQGTPDQRIIHKLIETDVWRYPGGPAAFYDDMMRKSESRKEKREEAVNDQVEYTAKEYHPLVFDKKKSFTMGKVV